MSKNGRAHAAFNPEKFLAEDTKKKEGKAFRRRVRHFPQAVVLADEFRAALYSELSSKYSQLFRTEAGPEIRAERAIIAAELLRKSLRSEGIRVDDDVFTALFFDFIRGFLVHINRAENGKT